VLNRPRYVRAYFESHKRAYNTCNKIGLKEKKRFAAKFQLLPPKAILFFSVLGGHILDRNMSSANNWPF
jgi:hypothetical protein